MISHTFLHSISELSQIRLNSESVYLWQASYILGVIRDILMQSQDSTNVPRMWLDVRLISSRIYINLL